MHLMNSRTTFLLANVPLSVVHFILFVLFGGFLGWPGTVVANALGAVNGGILLLGMLFAGFLLCLAIGLFVFFAPNASGRIWSEMLHLIQQ